MSLKSVKRALRKATKATPRPLGWQLRHLFFRSWMSLMLVFPPVGFGLFYANSDPIPTFLINLIAIIPCSTILATLSEDLIRRTGPFVGATLYMSIQNVAQLVLSILLLCSGQLEVLKISICGNILSNLLLMMGLGILAGACGRSEIHMNVSLAYTYSSLLMVTLATFFIPTAYLMTTIMPAEVPLRISRSLAVTTLAFYVFVLLYSLKTHRRIFTRDGAKSPLRKRVFRISDKLRLLTGTDARVFAAGPAAAALDNTPQFSLPLTAAALAAMTALVTFHTEFVSTTLSGFMASAGVSTHFTGIVLLPVLGNDIITISAAARDQMNISAAYTLGKCAQVALAIFPFCVVLGWGLGVPLMWDFDTMLVALLSISLLLVHSIISKARLRW